MCVVCGYMCVDELIHRTILRKMNKLHQETRDHSPALLLIQIIEY